MEFYAPKSFKKGRLINGKYRVIDVIWMTVGIVLTAGLNITYMAVLNGRNWLIFSLFCLPALLAMFLTMPAGIDHNMFELFVVIWRYWRKEKEYFWEGIHKDDVREESRSENV